MSCNPPLLSEDGELRIQEIGHQHVAGRVGDAEFGHRLWGDAAGPEHREQVVAHRHGVAIVGLGDVLDADQLGLAVSPLDEGWSSSQAYHLPAISEVHFAGTNKI